VRDFHIIYTQYRDTFMDNNIMKSSLLIYHSFTCHA